MIFLVYHKFLFQVLGRREWGETVQSLRSLSQSSQLQGTATACPEYCVYFILYTHDEIQAVETTGK